MGKGMQRRLADLLGSVANLLKEGEYVDRCWGNGPEAESIEYWAVDPLLIDDLAAKMTSWEEAED